MEINASLVASQYEKARQATEGGALGQGGGTNFAEMLQSFSDTLKAAETTAQDTMLGKVDPQVLVEALAQTQLAVEAAVTIRDKVVEAYQEILRMPV